MATPATNASTANRRDTQRSISCFSMASQQLFGFAVDEQRALDDDLIARVQPGLDLHFAVDRAADADLARGELVVARLDVDDVRFAVLDEHRFGGKHDALAGGCLDRRAREHAGAD